MRGTTDSRNPILATIFMALLFAIMPGVAQASGGGGAAPFDASSCIQDQMTAYTNKAQAQAVARAKVFSTATNPDMKKIYCWSTIEKIFDTIGIYTSNASLLGALIWTALKAVLMSLLNQVCAAVVGAITSAINMINNLLCVPIPHFNLSAGFSLGSFGGGTCNGISLLSITPTTGIRPMMPNGYSPLWNYTHP